MTTQDWILFVVIFLMLAFTLKTLLEKYKRDNRLKKSKKSLRLICGDHAEKLNPEGSYEWFSEFMDYVFPERQSFWVARDKRGLLKAYSKKPVRTKTGWILDVSDGTEASMQMLSDFLIDTNVTWEDEPIEIAKLMVIAPIK